MKGIFITILVALVAFAANSQDVTRNGANGKQLAITDFYPYYTGVATDTFTTVQDSITVAWFVNKNTSLFYDWLVKVNEVTSTGRGTVSLQSKKFGDASWSNITTVTYNGGASTGADTTIYFTQTTTKQFGNYYRFLFINTAGKLKVTSIKGALKEL